MRNDSFEKGKQGIEFSFCLVIIVDYGLAKIK